VLLQRRQHVRTTDAIQNGFGIAQRMGVGLTVAAVAGSPSDFRRSSDNAGETPAPALKGMIGGGHAPQTLSGLGAV